MCKHEEANVVRWREQLELAIQRSERVVYAMDKKGLPKALGWNPALQWEQEAAAGGNATENG